MAALRPRKQQRINVEAGSPMELPFNPRVHSHTSRCLAHKALGEVGEGPEPGCLRHAHVWAASADSLP